MKTLWWYIGIACRTIVVLVIALVALVVCFPPFGPVSREFSEVSGEKFVAYFGSRWPVEVAPKEIERASGKLYSCIDCHANWVRIAIRREAAGDWQDSVHAALEKPSQYRQSSETTEGVYRIVTNPTFVKPSFATAPKWWTPPPLDFRMTERMWYSTGATYADVLYSGFDPLTNTLWIFDYGQQHGQLWKAGEIPEGRQFAWGTGMNRKKNEEMPPNNVRSLKSDIRPEDVPLSAEVSQ